MAPYVIAMAIAMLLLFEKFVRVPRWLGRVCVWAAPSMFAIYLIHNTTSFGRFFFLMPLRYFMQHGLKIWTSLALGAIICFLICLAIDLLRRSGLYVVRAGIEKARGIK